MSDKSIADGTWVCPFCGAFNAEWLDKCGKCKKNNPIHDE